MEAHEQRCDGTRKQMPKVKGTRGRSPNRQPGTAALQPQLHQQQLHRDREFPLLLRFTLCCILRFTHRHMHFATTLF